MSNVELDWSTAEVKDSALSVALEGEVSRGWKTSFETTIKLLGKGEWGEVQLGKGKVSVSDMTPGTEEKLRHHLEAVVAQANAHEEAEEAKAEPSEEPGKDDEQDAGPDADMTARFRSFAEDEDSEEKEEKDSG